MEGNMNPKVVEALQSAEFTDKQALAIAAVIPDLEPLRMELRGEMERMESRLVKWMVGIFITFTTLLGGWITVLVIQLGLFA